MILVTIKSKERKGKKIEENKWKIESFANSEKKYCFLKPLFWPLDPFPESCIQFSSYCCSPFKKNLKASGLKCLFFFYLSTHFVRWPSVWLSVTLSRAPNLPVPQFPHWPWRPAIFKVLKKTTWNHNGWRTLQSQARSSKAKGLLQNTPGENVLKATPS